MFVFLRVPAVAMLFFLVLHPSSTLLRAQDTKESLLKRFEKLELTDDDKLVLKVLNKLGDEEASFRRNVALLLGLQKLAETPTSIEDLVVALASEAFSPIDDKTFDRALKGFNQLAAKPIYDALFEILRGKAVNVEGLESLKNYRPKGEFYRFLKMLQMRYEKFVAGAE